MSEPAQGTSSHDQLERDQLERFRALMPRLDPTQPIKSPDQQTWYVERPDGIGAVLGRTLQIDPASTHLLVGAIGCGKSTELLAAGRVLLGTPGIFARYVEASQAMALAEANSEMLLLALLDDLVTHLARHFPKDAKVGALQQALKPLVEGDSKAPPSFGETLRTLLALPPPLIGGQLKHIEPRLKRPGKGVSTQWLGWLEGVAGVLERLLGRRLVWLVDGLDRIADPIDFDRIVEPFLRALKAAGIGAVIVGPSRSITGVDRLGAADAFDELHWMAPVDPGEPTGERFLREVLSRRGVAEVTTAEALECLIFRSGGAIRILLQLAREAIKETWIRTQDQVRLPQAEVAAHKMGRSLLLGLTNEEVRLLQALVKTGQFAPRSESDRALEFTNRVMKYDSASGLPRYAAHPTLIRFLAPLPG